VTDTKPERVSDDPTAPFGRDDDGVALAPYGLKTDGTPRLSNRGARPGQASKGPKRPRTRPGVKLSSRTDKQRKDALVGLMDMVVVTPLLAASMSPQVKSRIGEKQTTALAGDAVIVSSYAPHLAEGLIVLSQSKPGALAWLDQVEEKAPYLMLMNVGLQMAKAFVENLVNPNEELAGTAQLMAKMRMAEMAQAIQQEAADMGVTLDTEPTVEFSAA
jgi:hypothetical protein